jgi:MFS family permease
LDCLSQIFKRENTDLLQLLLSTDRRKCYFSQTKSTLLSQVIQKRILPVIVLSQFAGTSLWFTGNAILPELKQAMHLSQYAVSLVTTAIMLGFVAGTLAFAVLSIADRYSPVKIFFTCSLLAALSNTAVVWLAHDGATLFLCRFATGFFLAGIYPVGMKIAADWYDRGLGKAMGYLLGALVLGTAFPHLLKNRDFELPWRSVLYCTSLFALTGGILMLWLVGDGPHRKKAGSFQWNALGTIFKSREWKHVAFGYFGHMWELYAVWGFMPLILELYARTNGVVIDIPTWSFISIGAGAIGCIVGGYLSQTVGSAKVAFWALLISCACCLLSPFFYDLPLPVFLFAMFIWGFTVSPDSPQFSTLAAQYAPAHLRGTALTFYNSIGFFIAILSLLLMDFLFHSGGWPGQLNTFALLGLGGITGLAATWKLTRKQSR